MDILRQLGARVRKPDSRIIDEVQAIFRRGGPLGCFGAAGELTASYGSIIRQLPLEHPRTAVVVMAADHGVAVHGISAFSPQVTAQMVQNYLHGGAGVNVLSQAAGADLFIVDVGVAAELPHDARIFDRKLAYGTGDFTKMAAMTRIQALKAINVGLEIAVLTAEKGYRLIVPAEMGIGNTTSSAAIAAVFTALPVEDVVGCGSGVDDSRLARKIAAVRQGLQIHKPDKHDPLGVIAAIGGFDIAAMAGLMIGAAACQSAILLDGVIAAAAAVLACALVPAVRGYLLPSHLSPEPAHGSLLRCLGLRPILDMGLRLGEGTGACLALNILATGIDLLAGLA